MVVLALSMTSSLTAQATQSLTVRTDGNAQAGDPASTLPKPVIFELDGATEEECEDTKPTLSASDGGSVAPAGAALAFDWREGACLLKVRWTIGSSRAQQTLTLLAKGLTTRATATLTHRLWLVDFNCTNDQGAYSDSEIANPLWVMVVRAPATQPSAPVARRHDCSPQAFSYADDYGFQLAVDAIVGNPNRNIATSSGPRVDLVSVEECSRVRRVTFVPFIKGEAGATPAGLMWSPSSHDATVGLCLSTAQWKVASKTGIQRLAATLVDGEGKALSEPLLFDARVRQGARIESGFALTFQTKTLDSLRVGVTEYEEEDEEPWAAQILIGFSGPPFLIRDRVIRLFVGVTALNPTREQFFGFHLWPLILGAERDDYPIQVLIGMRRQRVTLVDCAFADLTDPLAGNARACLLTASTEPLRVETRDAGVTRWRPFAAVTIDALKLIGKLAIF